MSHRISQVTAAMDLYSASEEERDRVSCFLDFRQIKDYPRNMQKPVVDRRVSGQEAQSESQKAFQLNIRSRKKEQPRTKGALQIFQNVYNGLIVSLHGLREELTQVVDCKNKCQCTCW